MLKKLTLSLIALGALALNASGDLFTKIESINKGLEGYIIGKMLTPEQQKLVEKNALKSDTTKIKKFLVGKDLLIAIEAKSNRVLAINKKLSNMDKATVKALIAEYIHKFDEPTAMAHDKMVYWVYDKNGVKMQEDDLKKYKEQVKGAADPSLSLSENLNKPKEKIDFDPYVSVKLSSDQAIMSQPKEPVPTNAYIMISSQKLISKVLEVAN